MIISQEHALSSLFLQKVGIWWRWLDSPLILYPLPRNPYRIRASLLKTQNRLSVVTFLVTFLVNFFLIAINRFVLAERIADIPWKSILFAQVLEARKLYGFPGLTPA